MSAHPEQQAPIGVFDSGVGGLSVLREIRQALPHEDLCYVADSGHAPYGDRHTAYILERSRHIVHFLRLQGCKAVVVACNTVTGVAIEVLRQTFPDLVLVAIEPAIKPALLGTRSGVVGVLATQQTVQSPGLRRLLHAHRQDQRVLLQACPGWVEHVEAGDLQSTDLRSLVARDVLPLLDQGADSLVLGCTHYPFLRPVIEALCQSGVRILDPAPAVARQLVRRLQPMGWLRPGPHAGQTRFWSSSHTPKQHAQVLATLWGHTGPVAVLPV